MALNVSQTISDVLAAIQKVRGQPVGAPPSRPGAEELAALLRAVPGEVKPGGIAEGIFNTWGAGAIKALAINAGQDQTGFADEPVAVQPAVAVTNNSGKPLENVVVHFRVAGGGGSITSGEVKTDKNGVATVGGWTLGAKGDNALAATAGPAQVLFRAVAVTSLAATSPTEQIGTAGKNVATPPAVKASDHAGRPVQGVRVVFAVTAGGGSVSTASVQTGADGLASCGGWKLGAAGPNSVSATAGLKTVEFKATAT
jgi:adhesin/invasin